MDAEIDDIEELKRWIAVGLQNAAQADAERLKLYIDLMLVGAEQFTGILQGKCAALAKQCRPRNVKPPNGNEQRREVAKRIKRWWVTNADGSVQLTVRYGSKPIEFAKGKNAIELSSASEISPTLTAISDAVMNGELDAALAVSSAFGRKLKKGAASLMARG